MSVPPPEPGTAGWAGLARRAIEWWALAGGVILLALVAMNVFSVVGDLAFGTPFAGDFEMTQVGACVAAFAFLPYCQLTGANVTADIFTAKASRRFVAVAQAGASALALGFGFLLAWRMAAGMLDQKAYGYTTTILQFPHWIAFVPILGSLGLLMLAAWLTLARAARTAQQG